MLNTSQENSCAGSAQDSRFEGIKYLAYSNQICCSKDTVSFSIRAWKQLHFIAMLRWFGGYARDTRIYNFSGNPSQSLYIKD